MATLQLYGGAEPYNISFSVFITGANIFFSEWLKLDFMVKSTAGKGVVFNNVDYIALLFYG